MGLSQGSVIPARCGATESLVSFSLYNYVRVCVLSLSLYIYMCVCVCVCGSRVELDRVLVCTSCYVMIHVQSTLHDIAALHNNDMLLGGAGSYDKSCVCVCARVCMRACVCACVCGWGQEGWDDSIVRTHVRNTISHTIQTL